MKDHFESLWVETMEIRAWAPRRLAAMQLAKAPVFHLGHLLVDPSARAVRSGERSETIEPRVMRVLVALGETPGQVLSRDDLIELCWDGQIVSDNAINRVISLLRRVLEQLADDAVRLETITKVGFRIVVDEAEHTSTDFSKTAPADAMAAKPAAPTAPPRKWTRRAAAGGLVAAGAGAMLAYAVWNRPAPYEPDPRALDLYQRAQLLLKSWELGSIRQAIAFNKQAVAIDPDYADAWGALAISYIHGLDGNTAEAKVAYPGLVRSAAERALALDPGQAEAHFALAIPMPHYRRWFDHEQRLRPLVRRFPDYWYGHAQLGVLLADVGRYEEAIVSYRRAREIDPMAPISWGRLAHALQQAGHDQEADLVLDEALARWPEHVHLWVTRSANLIVGRRFAEAIAFGRDPARRPLELPENVWRQNEAVATALATGKGAETAVELIRDQFQRLGVEAVSLKVAWLAALGAFELALEALEAYYLGGLLAGTRYPPPGPLDKRPTGFGLLNTHMLEHREHPRFKALLTRTGLEDYWRRSGSQPDFRKG